MIAQKRQFLYQPGPLMSIILWSWTLIVLLLAIIIALEVQPQLLWLPWVLGLFFVALTWAQIHYRHIYLENGVVRVSRVMNHQWVLINLHDVKNVHASKYRLGFIYGGKIYSFMLPANSVIEIVNLIEQAQVD
ncbi:pore-forming protein [Secundilactobacillus kimchicus]|nr:EbsA family protein [Secundilactobacillus kimchicus]MBT9672882.1 pore-forming protein [Secundilactobacillus kimchicus]